MKTRLILTALLVITALQLMAQNGPLTPAAFRVMIADGVKALHISPQPVAKVTDTIVTANDIQTGIRIYRPKLSGKFPVIYFIHGAAWIAGDLDTHDNICRYLTNALQTVVVAVDYRRPPEHKFPAAFNDSYAIFKWVGSHNKLLNGNGKLAVIGDSAGGGLAAAVCLLNASEKAPVPVLAQVLINPALDLSENSPTYRTYGMFVDWYLNATDRKDDVRISPLLAKDMTKTPLAIIVVGETDQIRADGETYAQRMTVAGIKTKLFIQPQTGHLATHWCAADQVAKPAIDFVVSELKKTLY
ncbi:alpha/beta hydrolase [Mucilaginibacter terrae]|uniref:alpha/beta hydrolase n=1 Tax=Mucilaginibacter terrae TaxID=1955052 RepID=UPI0036253340